MGGGELLDVTNVLARAVLLMDEAVDVAELKFDGGPHLVGADDGAEISDDLQASIEAAQVVVGEFENKKLVKDRHSHHLPHYVRRRQRAASVRRPRG